MSLAKWDVVPVEEGLERLLGRLLCMEGGDAGKWLVSSSKVVAADRSCCALTSQSRVSSTRCESTAIDQPPLPENRCRQRRREMAAAVELIGGPDEYVL